MAKIVTLGEIMLRLSPSSHFRISQATSFDAVYGGGEANVAVSCANYGHKAYFVSKLPDNELGQAIVDHLRWNNVNTDYIARGGNRVGIYFLEEGTSVRPSKVIYDRAHSAISEATIEDFDFDAVMKDADWFHWSGITPALSDNAVLITQKACESAKRNGVTISVDLNFREKLWTKEKAQSVMIPLMQYVDVYIGNEWHAQSALGFEPSSGIIAMDKTPEQFKEAFKEMKERFGFKIIANPLRESFSATRNGLKALLYDGEELYISKYYDVDNIIGRVGGGDAFTGGLIHGLLTKENPQEALEFGVASSILKLTVRGDFNLVTAYEVESFLKSGGNGQVKR